MFVGADAYRFTSGRGLGMTENMLEILACVTPCTEAPFSRLENMLIQNIRDTSGLICVMLNLDEKRRILLQRIHQLDVPLLIFIITEREPGDFDMPASGIARERFIFLRPDNIQAQLDRCSIPAELT